MIPDGLRELIAEVPPEAGINAIFESPLWEADSLSTSIIKAANIPEANQAHNRRVQIHYLYIQEPFPFLELPREIRDQIYSYACGNLALCADFTLDHTVSRKYASTMSSWIRVSATKQWRLLNMKDRPCASSKYWPNALNALLVSRQVHYEAALVFYSSSIFRIRKIKDVHSLTLRIRPRLRAQIRRLELNFYSFHLRTWEDLLKSSLALRFQSLRYLKIVLFEYDKPGNLRKLQDRHLGGHRSLEVSIFASDYKSKELRERDEGYAKVIIEWLEQSFNR